MSLRIVFMGTPRFAVPILKSLIENYQVVGVVSQPDKKVGRKQLLTPTPIKEVSAMYNIPIFQPHHIKEEYQKILDLKPDLIVTCAYGQILPKELLEYPKYKCINVHASLLPKLRGGAPIQHAIMDGYDKTGVTIMYMEEEMDTGAILTQEETLIEKNDTYETLHDRLQDIGSHLLLKTIPLLIEDKITPKKQEDSQASYGYNITKEEEKLDFSLPREVVDGKIRGLNPLPGAYALMNGKRLKIYASRMGERYYPKSENGTIIDFHSDGFSVVCNHEELIVTEIQIEGKKRCLVKDYWNGIDQETLRGIILK